MYKVLKPVTLSVMSAAMIYSTGCKFGTEGTVSATEPQSAAPAANSTAESSPDLQQNIAVIKAEAGATVNALYEKFGGIAVRHFHPKGICAKGKFIIDPDADKLPDAARIGPFAKKATYPMFGRFSNGIPLKTIDDRIPSVLGFGIKIVDFSSEKFVIPGSTKPTNKNQDWNLTTGRTFPIPTAAIYREQRDSSHDEALKIAFQKNHPEVNAALEGARTLLDSVLSTSYHSEVAFHWGEDHLAKFSVVPCNGIESTLAQAHANLRTPNYLHEGFRASIAAQPACFQFRAQIRPADNKLQPAQADWAQKYPAANPTIDWPPSVIPFLTLATIEFPVQTDIDALQKTCENFSINPGNTLQIFRPIETDTLTASRFSGAYEGSVTARMKLNGLTQSEPTAPNVVDDKTLEEWMHAPQ